MAALTRAFDRLLDYIYGPPPPRPQSCVPKLKYLVALQLTRRVMALDGCAEQRALLEPMREKERDSIGAMRRLCSKWEYAMEVWDAIGARIFDTTPAWHPATLHMCAVAARTGSLHLFRTVAAHYHGPANEHLFYMTVNSNSVPMFKAVVAYFGADAIVESTLCAAAHTGNAELFDAVRSAAPSVPLTKSVCWYAWHSGNDIFARRVCTLFHDQSDFYP